MNSIWSNLVVRDNRQTFLDVRMEGYYSGVLHVAQENYPSSFITLPVPKFFIILISDHRKIM